MRVCLWHLNGPADEDGKKPKACPTDADSSYARVLYCKLHAKQAEELDIDPIADELDNDPEKAGPLDVERITQRAKRLAGRNRRRAASD